LPYSVRRFARLPDAVTALAEEIVTLTSAAVAARGLCTLALAGGSTPRPLYARLAGEEFRRRLDWSRLHLFWADERWLSPEHRDSNYRLVRESLLDFVPLPAVNCHPMPTDGTSPEADARRHWLEIEEFFLSKGLLDHGGPCFDLILLGMGEDGHVASLFPHDPVLDEAQARVAAVAPPPGIHPAVSRLTMTLPLINRAGQLRLLLAGRRKARLLSTLTAAGRDLPVARLEPVLPPVVYLAEEEL